MKLAYNGFLANNSFNLSSTVLHNFKIIVRLCVSRNTNKRTVPFQIKCTPTSIRNYKLGGVYETAAIQFNNLEG